jgi:hypothetical protein
MSSILLEAHQITDEYIQDRAQRIAEQQNAAREYISNLSYSIGFISCMNKANKFDEIERLYDDITKVALKEKVEFVVVCNFIEFLCKQHKYEKADDIVRQLQILLPYANAAEKIRIEDVSKRVSKHLLCTSENTEHVS